MTERLLKWRKILKTLTQPNHNKFKNKGIYLPKTRSNGTKVELYLYHLKTFIYQMHLKSPENW